MSDISMNKIKRLGVRIGLELLQGYSIQNAAKGTGEQPVPEAPEGIEESLNIPYINRRGVPLAMDIFKPVGEQYDGKELPVIVTIHGGALIMGDRKISYMFSRDMAKRGYLVFAIEYRLAPRATVCEQLDDICAGMDLVGKKLVEYDVDFSRVFLTADSAGAFLATYTAAMKKSKKLQDAIGHEASRMTFKAVGLSCGMFYTNRDDVLGYFLSDQFYGDKSDDSNFLQYMDPENPEIINNLPPVFMVTARGDFLNHYTIMFSEALKKAGRTSHMLYYAEKELTHTFNVSYPDLPQSIDANNKMLAYFEQQAALARVRSAGNIRKKRSESEIKKQIADGSWAAQPMWKLVRDTNSANSDRLDAIALRDDQRWYSYRQMFSCWDNYAEVFSALHITASSGARVAMPGAMTTEAISAFYALNMTGASVSLMPMRYAHGSAHLIDAIRTAGATDVILTDIETPPALLRKLIKQKGELGLRNIIVLKSYVGGVCTDDEASRQASFNYHQLKQMVGVQFMPELLTQYEAFPIEYAPEGHSSEITLYRYDQAAQSYSPVTYREDELNAIICSRGGSEIFVKAQENRITALAADLSNSFALINMMHMPLTAGGTIAAACRGAFGNDYYKAIAAFHVNQLYIPAVVLQRWRKLPEDAELNMASVDAVYVLGENLDEKKIERLNTMLKERGSAAVVQQYSDEAKDFTPVLVPENMLGYPVIEAEEPAQQMNAMTPFMPFGMPAMPMSGMPGMSAMAMPGMPALPAGTMKKRALNDKTGVGRKILDTIRDDILPKLQGVDFQSLMGSLGAKSAAGTARDDQEAAGGSSIPSELIPLLWDCAGAFFDASTTDYYYEA